MPKKNIDIFTVVALYQRCISFYQRFNCDSLIGPKGGFRRNFFNIHIYVCIYKYCYLIGIPYKLRKT